MRPHKRAGPINIFTGHGKISTPTRENAGSPPSSRWSHVYKWINQPSRSRRRAATHPRLIFTISSCPGGPKNCKSTVVCRGRQICHFRPPTAAPSHGIDRGAPRIAPIKPQRRMQVLVCPLVVVVGLSARTQSIVVRDRRSRLTSTTSQHSGWVFFNAKTTGHVLVFIRLCQPIRFNFDSLLRWSCV